MQVLNQMFKVFKILGFCLCLEWWFWIIGFSWWSRWSIIEGQDDSKPTINQSITNGYQWLILKSINVCCQQSSMIVNKRLKWLLFLKQITFDYLNFISNAQTWVWLQISDPLIPNLWVKRSKERKVHFDLLL